MHFPTRKLPVTRKEAVTVTAKCNHVIESVYGLYANWQSRFGEDPNPFVKQALTSKGGASLCILHVPHEAIDAGDTTQISAALRDMVSTQEKAAAFRQRVGIIVDGYDDDLRALWQCSEVRQFFRRIFLECPFLMILCILKEACSRSLPHAGSMRTV